MTSKAYLGYYLQRVTKCFFVVKSQIRDAFLYTQMRRKDTS